MPTRHPAMTERYPNFPDALAGSRALAWTCRQSADREYNAHRALRTCGIATLEVKIIAHDRCISTKSGRFIKRLGNMICSLTEPPKWAHLITLWGTKNTSLQAPVFAGMHLPAPSRRERKAMSLVDFSCLNFRRVPAGWIETSARTSGSAPLSIKEVPRELDQGRRLRYVSVPWRQLQVPKRSRKRAQASWIKFLHKN